MDEVIQFEVECPKVIHMLAIGSVALLLTVEDQPASEGGALSHELARRDSCLIEDKLVLVWILELALVN